MAKKQVKNGSWWKEKAGDRILSWDEKCVLLPLKEGFISMIFSTLSKTLENENQA